MTSLERTNAEFRAAHILAGKRIVKLNFGRREDPLRGFSGESYVSHALKAPFKMTFTHSCTLWINRCFSELGPQPLAP